MKSVFLSILIAISFVFVFKQAVRAGDSSSSVNIQNNVNTGSQTTSTSTVKTHVKITTNGETIEKDSDKAEDIDVESSDGTAQVHIKNKVSSTQTTSPTGNEQTQQEENVQEKAAEKAKEVKEQVEQKKKVVEQKKVDLKTRILSNLDGIRKFFVNILHLRFFPFVFP